MKVRPGHLRIALIALGVAVLYNLWYFVLRPGPSAAARVAPQPPLVTVAADRPVAPAAVDPADIPAAPAVDVAAPPGWRRDPFLFGDETRARATLVPRAPSPAEPVVTSILFSPDRHLAIVGGRIVGTGESVGLYTVWDIERDAVVFTAPDGNRVRVFVHGSPSEAVAR